MELRAKKAFLPVISYHTPDSVWYGLLDGISKARRIVKEFDISVNVLLIRRRESRVVGGMAPIRRRLRPRLS